MLEISNNSQAIKKIEEHSDQTIKLVITSACALNLRLLRMCDFYKTCMCWQIILLCSLLK